MKTRVSFATLAAAAVLVTAIVSYEARHAQRSANDANAAATYVRGLAANNRAAIVEIQNLRTERKKQIAAVLTRLKESDLVACQWTAKLLTRLILPGLERIAKTVYYVQHPDEKAAALASIRHALKLASPAHCESLPSQHEQGS